MPDIMRGKSNYENVPAIDLGVDTYQEHNLQSYSKMYFSSSNEKYKTYTTNQTKPNVVMLKALKSLKW